MKLEYTSKETGKIMAIRDLEQYYNKLTKQHIELTNEYLEYAKEHVLTDADKQEYEIEQTNWKRVTYLMYLLHKPKKKEKQRMYERVNKKLLEKVGKDNTAEAVLDENKQAISRIVND